MQHAVPSFFNVCLCLFVMEIRSSCVKNDYTNENFVGRDFDCNRECTCRFRFGPVNVFQYLSDMSLRGLPLVSIMLSPPLAINLWILPHKSQTVQEFVKLSASVYMEIKVFFGNHINAFFFLLFPPSFSFFYTFLSNEPSSRLLVCTQQPGVLSQFCS